jgi:hypothetical protein
MLCLELFTCFDCVPEPLPASVPTAAPGAAIYPVILVAGLLLALIWRKALPDLPLPLRGKWLRLFMSGIVGGVMLFGYYTLCASAAPPHRPIMPW